MLARLFLPATIASLAAGWSLAAEPCPRGAGPPSPDFAGFFDQFFGPESEDDKQALAAVEVSPKEEQEMGRLAVAAFLAELKRQKIPVVRRGREVAYLQDLVETIRPLMADRDRYRAIQVYLAQAPRCDARSFPGGTLVFFRGLMDSAGSEAALIAIVGHELAHLDRGHHLTRARRVKLAQRAFAGGTAKMSFEQFFSTGSTVMRLWTHPFQAEDEAEADRDGARWAYRAGYDPREMGRLLLDLGKQRPRALVPLPDFIRSHPSPADRHRAVLEVYGQLQREAPLEKPYVGEENLRRRVARSRQEFDRQP